MIKRSVCVRKLGTGPTKHIWWSKTNAGHLIKRSMWMRSSCFRYKKCCAHRLSSWWGDVWCKSNKESYKQSRRFLLSTEDKFLVQVLNRSTRGEALLASMLTSVEEIIKEAVWAVMTTAWLSSWPWGIQAWQTAESESWTSREQTSSGSRNYWMKSSGKLSLGT